MFFAISGLLFFRDVDNVRQTLPKLRRRIRTLLVPYLIGCVFFVLVSAAVAQVPFAAANSNGSVMGVFSLPLTDTLRYTFWATPEAVSPLAFQLWFLRDLMLCMLLTPLLLFVVRHCVWRWVAGFALLVASSVLVVPVGVPLSAAAWFTLGAAAGRSGLAFVDCPRQATVALALLTVLFAVADALQWPCLPPVVGWVPPLVAVVALHALAGELFRQGFGLQQHRFIAAACQASFFIYLFHEPTLNIVRKLIVLLVGRGELGYSLSYLLSPWIFAAIATVIYVFLRRCAPQFLAFCTGGR